MHQSYQLRGLFEYNFPHNICTPLGHGQSGISSSELSLLMQVSEIETNYSTLRTRSVAANVFLTLNRPGFFESSTAGGGGRIPPPA